MKNPEHWHEVIDDRQKHASLGFVRESQGHEL